MSKNHDNIVEITDMSKYKLEDLTALLDDGKTLLLSLYNGDRVSESLEKGFSDYLNANFELKEEKENCGVCGCGKTANVLVYAWR